MQNPSFSISNPANCREHLASMNNTEDERRQHIKKDQKIFSQSLFFCFIIMPISVQGLDTFLNAWAWQMYSVDHFKHRKKKVLNVSRLVQSHLISMEKKVFNQDLFLSTLPEVEPCFFDSDSFYRETSSDTRCFLLWIVPFGLKKTLITAIFVTTSDMTSKHIGKWE